MLFLRIFQHLLPRSAAWRLTIAKTLRSFFYGTYIDGVETKTGGLAGVFERARSYIDEVWGELFPSTTEETKSLPEFEKQFGLDATNHTVAERRLALAAAWASQGAQDPAYIQEILRAAGFDVYIYEWWESGPVPPLFGYSDPPYVARDPHDLTEIPTVGTVQCSEFTASQSVCSEFPETQPVCNEWLANDPKYIVNLDLTPRPPPPIPDDPLSWRYFFYVAGAPTVFDPGYVLASRKAEFLRLIQKLKPSQQWVVINVTYEPATPELLLTEGDETLTTEDDEDLLVASL